MTKYTTVDDTGYQRISTRLRRWIDKINEPTSMHQVGTEAEVGKLVNAIEEMSAMPPSLSEDTPGNSINNYGSDTTNAITSKNKTGSGKQFIGKNQYFSRTDWLPLN